MSSIAKLTTRNRLWLKYVPNAQILFVYLFTFVKYAYIKTRRVKVNWPIIYAETFPTNQYGTNVQYLSPSGY